MSPSGSSPSARLRAFGGRTSREDALALFDDLPPVELEEMLGGWRGEGLATGHPFDGLLEALGWYGKRVDGPDEVHPLVFADRLGLFSVNPAAVPLSLVIRCAGGLPPCLVAAVPRGALRLLRTRRPKARLRMVEHRGVVTGTMSYDDLPVDDHFRAVDADTLLGLMDSRGLEVPFFFVLRRGTSSASR